GVVLCITGAEAMYAEMGQIGARPIRIAWLYVVFPCLLINYFGQGALLIARGGIEQVPNPFYGLVSEWMRFPLVIIATAAACIAAQATISGAFSVTRQAIHLGYLPRLEIRHTSSAQAGQIYMPRVNQLLMVGCIGLVLIFQR